MKIKKIIDLCKRGNRLFLYEGEGEQWISDGAGIYPLFELPELDTKTICVAYDIDEKKAKKMQFRHEKTLPPGFDFSDGSGDEVPAERGQISLFDGGRRIVPYMTSQGVVFVDADYLVPFSDIDGGMLQLFERTAEDGRTYFAVKNGFALVGIILPVDVINDLFVGRLEKLFTQCKVALFNKNGED